MKKFLISFLFILGFAMTAYAQPPTPPCSNSMPCDPFVPWVYHQNVQVALPAAAADCPACTLYVNWWERDCHGEIQIKMGSVSLKEGDCAACMEWIPSFAARWVLKNSPLVTDHFIGWEPPQTICVTNIKLSRFSCFYWAEGKEGEIGPYPGWYHMVQCAPELSGCCEYTVQVCKTSDGSINDAEYITSQPIACEHGCLNNCSFNDGEIWLKQGVASPEIKECNLGEIFEITPNPNDGNIHLKIAVKEKGVYTITVTDLRGNPVFETPLKLDGNTYESDLSLTGLASGPYLYKVTMGNKTYFNGKVNIIK